jgi:alkylation response protein AidB-like acyl-CoA dehydrogenase
MRAGGCAIAEPLRLKLVGPVIYTFGSDEQKRKYLPKILSGETFWCQGFSEPEAGSDLAALQTQAKVDEDDFIGNGRKIWTTEAHFADMMFCLARTQKAERPQDGISFLLLDMRDRGVTVRPIATIDSGHTVNEFFIDNVRVPVADLVGQRTARLSDALGLKILAGSGAGRLPGRAASHRRHVRRGRAAQLSRRSPATGCICTAGWA